MNQIVRAAVPAIVALVLLFVADRVLQPVPLPAASAVVGGLVALWFRRPARVAWVSLGAVAGLLSGVGLHVYVHLTGQSPPPQEGLAAHLIVNGGVGLVVAFLVVVALMLAYKALDGGHPTGRWNSGPSGQ